MPQLSFVVTVAMLSAFGLIASDIYLPAMPEMTREFAVDAGQMSQTLSAYLLMLAFGQLLYGPLADWLGRKPVLVVGVALYIAGSLGCAVADSYTMFLVWRMVEAAGAAAGLVIGRTLIADTCSPKASASVYAMVYPLVSLSPALAPLIGGHLAVAFGWHADFIFVAGFGLLTLLRVISLAETRPQNRRHAVSPFTGLGQICADADFWRYALIVCCIYSAWFIYLTQSPFLFARLNISEEMRGWLYIPLTAGIISANLLSRRLLDRWRYEGIVRAGILFFMLGGLAYMLALLTHVTGVLAILLPMCLVSLANGSSLSLAVSGAISGRHGQRATASGLIGFLQIGSAALLATAVSAGLGVSQAVLGGSVLLLSLVAFLGCCKGRDRVQSLI